MPSSTIAKDGTKASLPGNFFRNQWAHSPANFPRSRETHRESRLRPRKATDLDRRPDLRTDVISLTRARLLKDMTAAAKTPQSSGDWQASAMTWRTCGPA